MGSSTLVIKQTTSPEQQPTNSVPRCHHVLPESPHCCSHPGQPGSSSLPPEERDDSYLRLDLGRGGRLLCKRRCLHSPGLRRLVHPRPPPGSDQRRSEEGPGRDGGLVLLWLRAQLRL